VKKAFAFTLVGAAAGILVAQYFPALGKSGLDRGLSKLAYNLGAQRPYALDAGIGAGIGLLIGLFAGK
jgi:hypothetical protein